MTADALEAESRKYQCALIGLLPLASGRIAIYDLTGPGARIERPLLGIYSPEALLGALAIDASFPPEPQGYQPPEILNLDLEIDL